LIFFIVLIQIIGTYEHPLTKKKKFLLISDEFEKGLNNKLKEIILNQFEKQ
jgi:hypothetical protein